MMSDRKFRIVRRRYFNEKAEERSSHCIVEEYRKLGIFGKRWRPLKHFESWGGDVHTVTTEFNSETAARNVIEILRNGGPIDEWTREVVESDE